MTAESRKRIAARLSAAGVASATSEGTLVSSLAEYYDLLFRWNRTVNLTALPDGDHAIDRLIVEPVMAAGEFGEAATLIDVGSGGGSPAIPLKLARPAVGLTMIEARVRKAAFLREAGRQLGLQGAVVESRRVEDWATSGVALRGPGVISMRAVRPDPAMMRALAAVGPPATRLWYFGTEVQPGPLDGWVLSRGVPLLRERGSVLWVFHVEQ